MKAALRVLIASPIDFRKGPAADAIAQWAAVGKREVEAVGDTPLYAVCGVIDSKDPCTFEEPVGEVSVLVVRRTADPARAAAAGYILERIRLTREAVRVRADIIWFLDLNLTPPEGSWAALRAEVVAGAGGALVPHPIENTMTIPGVVIPSAIRNNLFALVDARTCSPEPGRNSFRVLGGGMGCVAVPMYTFLVVRFTVEAINITDEYTKTILSGEAVGWYMNAARHQVPIRALAGRVCAIAQH